MLPISNDACRSRAMAQTKAALLALSKLHPQ